MKTLIFGVTGQDGALLSKLLIEKNYEVFGVSRNLKESNKSNLKKLAISKDCHVLEFDQKNFSEVKKHIMNVRPDEIYFLAGQSSVSESFLNPKETFDSINFGLLNILEAIRELNLSCKIYNACSSECFGDTSNKKADENYPFNPLSPYAAAKISSFNMAKVYRASFDIFVSNGILYNHESFLRPEKFVTQKIIRSVKRIFNGSTEKLSLGRIDVKRDWGWAPEYVEAMWRMLQYENSEDFVIATGESNSLEDFVRIAFSIKDLNWKDHVTYDDTNFNRPSELLFSCGNPTKAENLLGWKAQNKMNEVIKLMIQETF